MSRGKWMLMLVVFAATALVVGASPATADITFGQQPAPDDCGGSAFVGFVCGINETFGDSVTAHGFTGAPGSGAGNVNLTFKPTPPNSAAKGGLGVQSNNTAVTCTDPECEIAPPTSVSATRNGTTLITDAIIGSVESGDTFNFFVQTTEGGAFTQLNGAPIGITCVGPGFVVGPVAETCQWFAPAGQTRFGVAVQAVAGDELLNSVSTAVPEPTTLLMVGTALVGLGAGWRRRLSKKA